MSAGDLLVIYAVNIHTGGGKVLLDELLTRSPFEKITGAFLDARYPLPKTLDFPVYISKSRLWGRLKSEFALHRFLKNNSRFLAQEEILFFGNIPPFFKPRNPSRLYLQNCFLTRQVPLPHDSFKLLLRLWIESRLLKLFSNRVDEVWVQTKWMKSMTLNFLPQANVRIKPFLPTLPLVDLKSAKRTYDLLFVGSFAAHKRLSFFLEALKLVEEKLTQKIKVFIAMDHPPTDINLANFKLIELELRFQISHGQLLKIYADSKVFVATSLYESFYLPLYEAHHYRCNIIAPLAGYTEDLNFKVSHFDSSKKEDLARAILTSLQD